MLGKTLGPYLIRSELGSGAMGVVYLAEARERCAVAEGARVALKLVHTHLLSEPGYFKRFLREAEIGRAVVHPNVVRCHDCDQLVVDGEARAFLVMEYVEGQTLRGLLSEMESVPEELCRHIGREVARGLQAIHGAGVVHRDMKPENVLITADHEVKVMDLGVARLRDEAIRLSESGTFVGTVLYAAPEQFGEGKPDGRTDLFSLGVILYELSTGVHPHPGSDIMQVLAKLMEGRPRRAGIVNPQLSPFFEELVHQLLALKPERRFASAGDLLDALENGEVSTWWGRRVRKLRVETKRPLRRVRIPRETAVYGRSEELSRLRSLFDRAKAGEGMVVFVEGEAGIGKSRLVDEFVGSLWEEGEDLNFLHGSYPPSGAATSYGAWSTAYREHFGAENLPEALRDYLTVTPSLVPAFAALLRGEPGPGEGPRLDRDSMQTVFVHATRALAGERPTIVLIDDLHFAPEEGRALFASLALAVPGHRILLVGTARPGLPESWRADLERMDATSRMELMRLGPKDLVRLLRDAFRSDRLAEDLAGRIAVKSDGNPFFVFEIVRELRELESIVEGANGKWERTGLIGEIQIPSSVADLIRARIAALEDEDQELLEVAACCGFAFDPRLLADVVGLPPIPTLRRLGKIERRHGLVRAVGADYVFDHHQVQEALYAGIAEPLREEYHAGIGAAFEARNPEPGGGDSVDLCEHLYRGGRPEAALSHLDAALEHLGNDYSNEHAILLCGFALADREHISRARRVKILIRLSGWQGMLGRHVDQESSIREAVALADGIGDLDLRCGARRALARHFSSVSSPEKAIALYEEVRDLLQEAGRPDAEESIAGGLGAGYLSLGRLEEAEEHLTRWIETARASGDRPSEGRAATNLGSVALSRGRCEEARELYGRALEIAREAGDRVNEGMVTGILGLVHRQSGRQEEARASFERSLEINRETGYRQGEGWLLGCLGENSLGAGRLLEAKELFEGALAITREIGHRKGHANSLGDLGGLHLLLGRPDRAREHFERKREVALGVPNRRVLASALRGLGAVAAQEREPEEARRHFEEALRIRREVGSSLGLVDPILGVARLHAEEGRSEDARSCFTEALEIAEEAGLPDARVLAACHLAVLPEGDPRAALRTFEELRAGLPVPTSIEAGFLLWRATGDRGHLEEAHRLLRDLRDHAPEECRETIIANVPLHREVTAAWEEQAFQE